MGNTNTINGDQQLPINFKQLKRQQHSILGNIKFIENSYDQKHYILVQKTFASQIQYQKCLKKLKNRIKLSKMQKKYLPNEYILQILQHRNNQYTQICGKTFKIFIFIKQFDTNLKKIFLQKLNNNVKFNQQQLLQLILKITNCLIQLYDHNIKPFHLSMQSIIFQNNKCKLIDTDLTMKLNPIDSFNYRAELRKGTFIAPELLSTIDNRQNYIYNSSKCDIFTLGMIILQLASNTFLDHVYDYNHRRINFNKIQSLIQSVQFSQFFKQTLKQMLAADQSQRIGLLRLKQNIKNHTKDLFQSSQKLTHDNKIQNYEPLSNVPKFVPLGKRISQRQKFKKQSINQKNQSHLINPPPKQIQISQNKSNIKVNYSFHMLHNNKIQNKSKKSISFGSQMSFSNINNGKNDLYNEQLIVKNSVLNQFPQNKHIYKEINRKNGGQFDHLTNYDQNIKSNFNYYPENLSIKKPQQPQCQDLSDNRSDKPISPITYQSKDKLQSRKDSLIIHQIDKKKLSKPYYQFIKDFQFSNLQIKSPLNKKQNQRIQDKFVRQFPNNQQFPFHKKQKIQIKDNQTYRTQKSFIVKQFSGNYDIQLQNDKFNFNYSPLKTFNKLPVSKQSQRPYFKLQNTDFSTPRIQKVDANKNNQVCLMSPQVKVKINDTSSKKFYSLQRQTPIKSLQLLQTIQKKSNLKSQVPNQNKKTFGRYDFSNGSTYQGEFNQKNQFQGNGVLYFPSGKVFYSGCWKANQFHGFGILNNFQSDIPIDFKNILINYKDFNLNDNSLWTQYEGEFFQDKKHGFGTLFFINGDKFSGCFVSDSIQGYGNFYQANFSKTIMGIWNNNIFYSP